MAALCSVGQGLVSLSLPGGATNLTESHDNWIVHCGVANNVVSCIAQQEQRSNQTKRRVLAIELIRSTSDIVTGTLVLPFGLQLTKGAVLKVDDKLTSPPEPFQTCLPGGCIVPLSTGKDWLAAMQSGTAITVAASAVNGQAAKFSISLRGWVGARSHRGVDQIEERPHIPKKKSKSKSCVQRATHPPGAET